MNLNQLQRNTLLHISLISRVGPAIVERLVAGLSLENIACIYELSAFDIAARCALTYNQAQMVVQGLEDKHILAQELMLIEQHGATVITRYDDTYPELLKHIHMPPPVLYVKGCVRALHQTSSALVGSRNADAYGQAVISHIVPSLVKAGMCIVSGGALGADTMAHQAALAFGGTTVAVIGSGLAVPYPLRNKKLFTDIVASSGAVVSPFPLLMQAVPGNFPARNRIIAGLAQSTIVVQAAAQSGALITARYALDSGRDVFAVPGLFGSPLSAGCHALLKEGAQMLSCMEDLCIIVPSISVATVQTAHERALISMYVQPDLHHEEQDPVVAACVNPQFFDDLCILTKMPHEALTQRLFDLMLDGRIEQDSSGRWVIKNM